MTVRRVIFSRQAAEQIEASDLWWRTNRPDAATTVRDEIDRACAMLAAHPSLGAAVRGSKGHRRYLLRATSYWLYYRSTEDSIRVVRVWHTSRRSP